jgi:hypothetical protein
MRTVRMPTCLACCGPRMKFSPNHPPGSLQHLTERAEIPAAGCPRCRSTTALGPHGHLRGNSPTDGSRVNRGLRFFCSNRCSNPGCGGTFSVHWNTVIPCCPVRTLPTPRTLAGRLKHDLHPSRVVVFEAPHVAGQRLPVGCQVAPRHVGHPHPIGPGDAATGKSRRPARPADAAAPGGGVR